MPITGSLAADFSDFDKAVKVSAAELAKFEAGAIKATSAFTTLGTSLQSIDRIAALAGVRLGPLAGAFNELGAIITTTSQAMTTLGPAALAVGAAFATLKVAEVVRDYTSLDEKLTDIVYQTAGWTQGTKVASTAQDELARATAWSGVKITDLTVAMQLNAEAARIAAVQAADLARYEERAADAADALQQRFLTRFKERTATQDAITRQSNEANRAFENYVNERLIADHARALEQQAKDEKAWRDYQNEQGIRWMENDAAMLRAEVEAHRQATEALKALEATKYQDFVGVSQPLNQNVVTFDPATGKVNAPAAPGNLMMFGEGGQQTPMIGFPSTAGAAPVTINMSGMLMSTDPSALDSLRQTINRALGPTLRHQYHPSS
jgi:hypothetical protein